MPFTEIYKSLLTLNKQIDHCKRSIIKSPLKKAELCFKRKKSCLLAFPCYTMNTHYWRKTCTKKLLKLFVNVEKNNTWFGRAAYMYINYFSFVKKNKCKSVVYNVQNNTT